MREETKKEIREEIKEMTTEKIQDEISVFSEMLQDIPRYSENYTFHVKELSEELGRRKENKNRFKAKTIDIKTVRRGKENAIYK